MTRQWKFHLAIPRAPKGLSMNDRAHWRAKAASTAWVRGEVVARVVAAGVPTLDRCRVDVEWIVGTRHKRDTDNLAPFLKAIYDGIGSDRGISAHVVTDDDPTHMEKRAATIRYEQGCTAHFEVTITEVSS